MESKLKNNIILIMAGVISFFTGLCLAWFVESSKLNMSTILNLFQFAVLIITIRLSISSMILRTKTIKGIEDLNNAKKVYDDYVEKQTEVFNNLNSRADLLSRENSKVREENENLKDRLRNLGIKDFDVIN